MSSKFQRPFKTLATLFNNLELPKTCKGSPVNPMLFRRLAMHHVFTHLGRPDLLEQDLKKGGFRLTEARELSISFRARYGGVLWPNRLFDDEFDERLLRYFLQLLQLNLHVRASKRASS
jgi:hypothetical protein